MNNAVSSLTHKLYGPASRLAGIPFILRSHFYSPDNPLRERIGEGAWRRFPKSAKGAIWFHAASVGEVGGLLPLVKLLQGLPELPPRIHTTTSLTGRSAARHLPQTAFTALLPIDHRAIVSRVLAETAPSLIVISETEIWPNFLLEAKRREIPLIMINARISDASFPRYKKFKSLFIPALSCFDAILSQTERDREKLEEMGAPVEKLRVIGNCKYDRKIEALGPEETLQLKREFGLCTANPTFVAGSVRAGEGPQVVEAYLQAKTVVPKLQLILAPRHPERFEQTAALLEKYELAFHRRSKGTFDSPQSDVLLFDTIGELTKAYQVANCAFVGGSLVNIGGHNPLEPAALSKPILMGPHWRNVSDVAEELSQAGGLVQVKDSLALAQALARFVSDPKRAHAAGLSALTVAKSHRGAAKRIIDVFRPYLHTTQNLKRAGIQA